MTTPELPQELQRFLYEWLGSGWTVTPLFGDASTRVYFRVEAPPEQRFMMAYYPSGMQDDLIRFMDAYRAISSSARVPEVHHEAPMAVIQADLGDETLFDLSRREPARAETLYRKAIDLLVAFQHAELAATVNPPFDSQKFLDELQMTGRYYVEELQGLRQSPELDTSFRHLADTLAQHPYILCHRDYHAQNIHIFNDDLYMIDYQDLRSGPDTYDLASLLRDRGAVTVLGREAEERLIGYYSERTGEDAHLRSRYLEALLQRSIKAVGTFARQAVSRGRNHYLDFIPSTLESIRFCLHQLPEFERLLDHFPLQYHRATSNGRPEGDQLDS